MRTDWILQYAARYVVALERSYSRFFARRHRSPKGAADKILADIERRVLSSEVLRVRGAAQQLEAASLIQSSLLPDSQPLHQDYDVGGFTHHAHAIGSTFHSWNVNCQEQIVGAIGAAQCSGAAGALIAARLQTIIDMHESSKRCPSEIVRRANDMIGNCKTPIGEVRLESSRSNRPAAQPRWLVVVASKPS